MLEEDQEEGGTGESRVEEGDGCGNGNTSSTFLDMTTDKVPTKDSD